MSRRKLREPYRHQREGYRWAYDRSTIALLWEMRLGKTLVVIRWAQLKGLPAIVVCPGDIIDVWVDELRQEGFDEGVHVLRGHNSKWPPSSAGYAKAQWCVCSYETFRASYDLQIFPWCVAILDEAHAIKNPKAETTIAAVRLGKNVPHRAIMTGTFMTEHLLEAFCPMQFLGGGRFLGFKSYYQFRSKMFEIDSMGYDYSPVDGAEFQILQGVDKYAHVLTRSQAGLPNVEVQTSRSLDMPLRLRSIYRHVENQFVLKDQETKFTVAAYTWMSRLAGGCHPAAPEKFKTRAVSELLRTEFKNQQVVIWCNFQSEIDALLKVVRPGKASSISGNTRPADRAKINHKFQDGGIDVLICQVQCAGLGRNFSAASTSLYFSLPWSLKDYLQSKDRIVHPGKKDSTLTVHLLTKDSLNSDIHEALQEKRLGFQSYRTRIRRNFLKRHGR